MFQVGDIVQVIIVPKKYKQYDIAGATGVVKTVYSNNIRIHISSYYNEESEEGDFYFKENELNNFTRKENDMSIIELWEKRSIEKIDKEAEIKLMELLAEDEYTHDLILHMNDLKDAGFKVEIKKVAEEIGVLLEMCKGDVVKEMEILCSYRVVEYPFGRMTVGGSTCGK